MDPIRSKSSSDIPRPAETRPAQAPQSAEQASAKFEIDSARTETARSAAAAAADPNFERLRGRIEAGIAKAHPRQRILEDLVDDELERAFGKGAGAEVREAVVELFGADPQLSDLFNQLYARAARDAQTR